MTFPTPDHNSILKRLEPPAGKVRVVIDTDTYNEIDDQFAVVYALLSKEKMDVEAIYAAPFTNNRSTGPGDGMEKSYDEILRLLERLKVGHEGFVFRGSTHYLAGRNTPEESPAALDLVERAKTASEANPLYVVALGAITNVASALLIAPEITRRLVVVWLGGHAQHLHFNDEFNLAQDPRASQIMFDSGVALVQIPALGAASHLLTTKVELEQAIVGRNAISDFLYERFCEYSDDHFAWAKEIWDISAVAYLLNESWTPSTVVPSPILHDDLSWEVDPNRHPVRIAWFVRRNEIFRDLFERLQKVQD
jgi:purine nucleosidase